MKFAVQVLNKVEPISIRGIAGQKRILGLWNPVPLNHGHSLTDQTMLFVALALTVPPETCCCGNNAAHGSISLFLQPAEPWPTPVPATKLADTQESGANCFSAGLKPAQPPFSVSNAPVAVSWLRHTGAVRLGWDQAAKVTGKLILVLRDVDGTLGMWFNGQHSVLGVELRAGLGRAVLVVGFYHLRDLS